MDSEESQNSWFDTSCLSCLQRDFCTFRTVDQRCQRERVKKTNSSIWLHMVPQPVADGANAWGVKAQVKWSFYNKEVSEPG